MALEWKFLISYLTYSVNKQTEYYHVLLKLYIMPRDVYAAWIVEKQIKICCFPNR